MKKFIFSVLALFGMTMTLSAQTLTLPEEGVEAVPGETVKATLKLNCDANTFVGFKFTLQFPADNAAKFSIKGLSGVSQPTVGKMNEGKVIFTGINGVDSETADIIYLDGTTDLEISIAVAEDLPIGTYPVQVIDFQLDQKGTMVDVAGGTFNINVVNAHTVTLDENSEVAPEPATGVNVKVLRTMKADEWSTICLPFAMSEAQVKSAFGDGVQLGDFTGCEVETNDEEDIVGIKVNFDDATAIEANHPYIIKVPSEVKEFYVEEVELDPQPDDARVDKDENKVKVGGKWYYFYNSIVGTYVANTEVPENCLFVSGNKFWYSTGATKMKAFRAYFDFQDLLKGIGGDESRIVFSFGEQTGIGQLASDRNDGEYYNLRGQRVETPAKGIYIKDGKKVVVK